MKVLLILPPSVNEIPPFLESKHKQFPLLLGFPLGLGYIAAYLRKHGDHEVKIIDADKDKLSIDNILNEIMIFNPNVVGMTMYTINSKVAVVLAKEIKKLNKIKGLGIKVIAGGPHASDDYPNVLTNYPYFDYIVVGEGEITFAELLSGADPKGIRGLAYTENGEIVFTGVREYENDIDKFPPPARDLVDFGKYIHSGTLLPYSIEIMGSRGCTNRCVFCSFQKRWRARTSEEITKEMKELVKKYPQTKTFLFYDDNFSASKSRVIDLCKKLISEGLNKYKWSCLCRADHMDEEMISWMKLAGCGRMLIGLETADPFIMKKLNKHIKPEKVKEVVEIIDRYGVDALVFFIIGNPGETKKTVRKSYNLAKKLKCQSTFWSIMQVFPGTQLAKWQPCKDFVGYVYEPEIKKPCAAISANVMAFENPGMDREQMKRTYQKVFRDILIYKAFRYPLFTLRKLLVSPSKALRFLLGLFKYKG